jgi:imidazolonepropionase-like amidohydrolase
MSKLFSLLPVIALSLLLVAQAKPGAQPQPLVFTHVTVIDTTGPPPEADMTVILMGDRIIRLGKSAKVSIPRGAQVVDATGKSMIPSPSWSKPG